MPSYFIFSCFLILAHAPSFSQIVTPDTALYQAADRQGIDISSGLVTTHAHLYNGSEYVNYDDHVEGHQFFKSQVLEEGTLVYDDIQYENVPMLYDIVKDEVIIEHFNRYYKIKLVSEKVSRFSLLTHTFVRFEKDTTVARFPAGFYELLYDGKVKVLAKRAKRYKETLESQRVIRQFLPADKYFIQKGHGFYPVKGKNAVLKIFESRKKEIKQLIQKNSLNFKYNFEQALTAVSQLYDNLENE